MKSCALSVQRRSLGGLIAGGAFEACDRSCATKAANRSRIVPWPAWRYCGGHVTRFRFSRDARVIPPSLATVLRQAGKARWCECEAHHTPIAAPALMLGTAGGGLSRICDNDDAAVDLLVVQDRDVRAISRSLPVHAARTLKLAHDFPGRPLRTFSGSCFRRASRYQVCPINLRNAAAPSCIASRPFQAR